MALSRGPRKKPFQHLPKAVKSQLRVCENSRPWPWERSVVPSNLVTSSDWAPRALFRIQLTHWTNNETPKEFKEDLSTEMCFRFNTMAGWQRYDHATTACGIICRTPMATCLPISSHAAS